MPLWILFSVWKYNDKCGTDLGSIKGHLDFFIAMGPEICSSILVQARDRSHCILLVTVLWRAPDDDVWVDPLVGTELCTILLLPKSNSLFSLVNLQWLACCFSWYWCWLLVSAAPLLLFHRFLFSPLIAFTEQTIKQVEKVELYFFRKISLIHSTQDQSQSQKNLSPTLPLIRSDLHNCPPVLADSHSQLLRLAPFDSVV